MKKKKKNTIPNPPWKDLNPFILSKIFSSLSLHDQLFGPPCVCRSWRSATLQTLFHNSNLDLRSIDDLDETNHRSRYYHFLKVAVDQYDGWVSITFPRKHAIHYFAAVYIAERTPNISHVSLPSDASVGLFPAFMSLIYWKKLRVLHAPVAPERGFMLVSHVADHCRSLVELRLCGELAAKEASCIALGLPSLKVLDLSESTLCGDALAILLDGRLKCLKELNVLHCSFVGEDGEHISKDYEKMKDFKKGILAKSSGLKSLGKFLHCLGKTCQHCNF